MESISSGYSGKEISLASNLYGDELNLSAESFSRFAQFITRELGIKMSPEKVTMLKGRLIKRLRLLQIRSFEEYQNYLFASPQGEQERIHFMDAITTNKTDFFREPQHFEFLKKAVLPAFTQTYDSARQFTLWCAGCSSGEEAYTQAMVLESYAKQCPDFAFKILATDISTRVLDHAKTGIYSEESIGPIPFEMRRAYLMRSKDPREKKFRISPALRSRISFHRLNFMETHYDVNSMFDVIFFRNVMIYFDKPIQEAVVNKLCQHLRPGGYLFIGHSETLNGLHVPVVPISSSTFRKPR